MTVPATLRHLRHLVSLATLGLVACAAPDKMPVHDTAFTLWSPQFADNSRLETRHAGNIASNPNCVGQNVAPALAWKNVPPGTKSIAIVMFDPEGRGGSGVYHWVAYGIDPALGGFAENEINKPSPKFIGGKSTQGVGHYSGPCTPPGSPHHYTFKIIATDLDPKDLPPDLTLPELEAKLAGNPSHAKGAAGLVGLFTHP